MIGKRIKELRKSNKITQDELGFILGLSGKSAISNYENGYSTPDNDMLNKIADYFHVSTDYLLGRTDDPTPIRDVDQDLYDEHDYTKELEAVMADEPLRTEFQDYKDWPDEDKRNLLIYLEGQRARREKNKKN
ncbi:helix-turn-helix transcriptional regulator [Acetobacterium wieringae]|uniref:helix-turn-helix domain-containing protein n=1 Tax=Acetobacterium wieringae TaxID=52694 RepID=UPI002B21D8F4|nr:helix-turn-helix transcriptional regulator [Acetobacterium wieringae]MEA4805136.1 helix-turn-helix transcriptional regulator [Acetobacterium wieringae]